MVVSSSRTIAVATSSISTLRGPAERASTSWTGRGPAFFSPGGAVWPRRAAAAAMSAYVCVCYGPTGRGTRTGH
eukprot:2950136-Prymnesium_polylepis.1